jgi:hypothetical protein
MPAPIRSALFVDFDNVYLNLEAVDRRAAERFATDPMRWLTWLEQTLDAPDEGAGEEGRRRRVIVRRCYLNPGSFGRFRPDFIRAAFNVTDCPPLTARGKTSADIYLAMGVLDVLAQLPHVEEYIILSADADFTPVLLRLRSYDRRTVVLAVGPASVAYTTASDLVLTEETFVEEALGLWAPPQPLAPERREGSTASPALLRRAADRFYEEASASGELPATEVPRVLKEFPEFTQKSNWLGFYGLRPLVEAVVAQRGDLTLSNTEPWSVVVTEGEAGPGPALSPAPDPFNLRGQVVEAVRTYVAAASHPVSMGAAAQHVIRSVGEVVLRTQWAGAGTFRALLLRSAPDPGFEVVTFPGSPGYLFDPARHERPSAEAPLDRLATLAPDLADFIRRINGVTQVPALSPAEYLMAFEAIGSALAEQPYHPTETSKRARDLTIEWEKPVNRQAISFVLKGLTYNGYPFALDDARAPERLARAYRDNVLWLAQHAGLALNDEQQALLDVWLLGEAASSAPERRAEDAPGEGSADDGWTVTGPSMGSETRAEDSPPESEGGAEES